MKYQSAENFNQGLAKVKSNDKWGFIDKKGNEIVPIKYQDALPFKDGWGKVKSNEKWGAVDKSGAEIVPTRYDEVFHINLTEGLAKVKLNKKWGAVDKAGNEVIAIKYDDLYPYFFENLATVKWNGKWGFIDRTGREVIPAKYDDSRNFTDGLAQVQLNGVYGLIDKTGKEVIPIKYQTIHWFSEGLAAVQINKKWGFVDKAGNEVIPPQYDYAHDFSGGKALVTKDGKDFTIAKPTSSNIDNTVVATTSTSPEPGTMKQPPVAMKGIIDPAIVGTWKYHDNQVNFNGFYIFRADGTYDYYADMITPSPPAPSYKNFWRVDGEEMEFIIDGKNQILRQKVLRRNDPQSNKPALLIPWNSATEEYRAYYPTQAHELWKTANTQKSNTAAINNPAAVKLVDPPVRLNGIADLSVVGLWKCNYNKIDYWLDLKADGTYNTYSATNSKPVKCYWRINGDYIETFCEGAKQVSRFVFRKINDLKIGKPTITLDGVAYFPETDKEMWKGM